MNIGEVCTREVVFVDRAGGLDVTQTEIGRFTDGKFASVPASASIDEAITTMKKHGVRRLLVSSDGGQLHGIVSLDDVLDALAHEMSELAHAVRSGIERETAERAPLPAVQARAVRISPYSIA